MPSSPPSIIVSGTSSYMVWRTQRTHDARLRILGRVIVRLIRGAAASAAATTADVAATIVVDVATGEGRRFARQVAVSAVDSAGGQQLGTTTTGARRRRRCTLAFSSKHASTHMTQYGKTKC